MTAKGRKGRLLKRAEARAQRRLHTMVRNGSYRDIHSRDAQLYVQAERLLDRLLDEAPAGFGLPCCGADPVHWVGCVRDDTSPQLLQYQAEGR